MELLTRLHSLFRKHDIFFIMIERETRWRLMWFELQKVIHITTSHRRMTMLMYVLSRWWWLSTSSDCISNWRTCWACPASKGNIFPTVWRPLGRNLAITKRAARLCIDPLVNAMIHSLHENPSLLLNWQLYSYYPWMERGCFKTLCAEQIIFRSTDNNVPIHQVRFEKYWTQPFFDSQWEHQSYAL